MLLEMVNRSLPFLTLTLNYGITAKEKSKKAHNSMHVSGKREFCYTKSSDIYFVC